METAETQEIVDDYLSRLVLAKDLKPRDNVEVSGYDRTMTVNSIEFMPNSLDILDEKYMKIVFFDNRFSELHVQYYRENRVFSLV